MECSICFAGNKTLLNIFDETGKSKNICATLKIHFPFLKVIEKLLILKFLIKKLAVADLTHFSFQF